MDAPTLEPPNRAPVEASNPTPAADAAASPEPSTTLPAPTKLIHSLVLDSGELIKNDISISTLLSQAQELYTVPAVISELRDEATRVRIQPLLPFLKLRTPVAESIKFVANFARGTGDLQVLSRVDLQLVALTYELEKERNNGDWRLRKDPRQKGLNGSPPEKKDGEGNSENTEAVDSSGDIKPNRDNPVAEPSQEPGQATTPTADGAAITETGEPTTEAVVSSDITDQIRDLSLGSKPEDDGHTDVIPASELDRATIDGDEEVDEDGIEDDGDGEWITPSNVSKHRVRDNTNVSPRPIDKMLQAALLTSDMAMRNVALRINLNLLDSTFSRVTYLKTWALRCHTCMKICKETKQFCPSCGHPTLTRVSVSTDANNNFKVHLKKNFQWNKRGNVYSIPKPTHGSASGKVSVVKGGGKNGWGQELILAEDQKEYARKIDEERRAKHRDLMDEDYLPSLLTGGKKSGHGKVRVGAGRSVNSRKGK